MPHVPSILFCVTDLTNVTGGIAVLNRIVYQVLSLMHDEGQIKLTLTVLNEARPRSSDPLMEKLRSSTVYWCSGSKLRFVLKIAITRPDLTIFDHAGPTRATLYLPKVLRRPYCTFVHGVELIEQFRPAYLKSLMGADFLLTNSKYTMTRIRKLHQHLPPIKVCLLGLDPTKPIVRGNVKKDINELSLLIVGRLSANQRHKGHDHVLDSMPFIVEKLPDLKLHIVGDGDDMSRLRRRVADLRLDKQVQFHGRIDDDKLGDLYDRCTAFIMPSKGDGFGFVFTEAMAHAKPCIGLIESAAEEIIDPGKTGILVDRDDNRQMAQDIIELISNPKRCREMGNAGLERLQKEFDFCSFNKRFTSILFSSLRGDNQT